MPARARCAGSPTPGHLQDVRRADRAARQDDFARRLGTLHFAAALELDAGRALAVEQNAAHERIGDDGQIWALQRRTQIGARRALATSAAPRLLHPADAVLAAMRETVDILAVFEADLFARLDH